MALHKLSIVKGKSYGRQQLIMYGGVYLRMQFKFTSNYAQIVFEAASPLWQNK